MAVHDGNDIVPRLVDFTVDETLEKAAAAVRIAGIAVEIVLDDVVGSDQRGRDRACHQIPVGRRGMTHRNVAERAPAPLSNENATGCRQIRDELGRNVTAGFRCLLHLLRSCVAAQMTTSVMIPFGKISWGLNWRE